jgi:LytS/YehU family sensor histidine kinase
VKEKILSYLLITFLTMGISIMSYYFGIKIVNDIYAYGILKVMLGFIIGFPVCALIMFVSMKIQKLINK